MIRIFKVVFLFIMSLAIFSCNKTDDPTPPYVIPYEEQYPVDLAAIDKYLDEYHMDVNPNKDVTFTKITTLTPGISIRVEYASMLRTKTVASNGVNYKVYYISLDDGTKEQPTEVDSVFVSYKGEYLYNKKEEILPATNPATYNTYLAGSPFDQAQNPVWFPLSNVIQGWKEIMPFFKSGTNTTNPDGSVNFIGFGAGVMFLPSGLAYYNNGIGSIPAYSPLIFSFKLMEVNLVDNDYDRINSKDEAFDIGTGTYNFSKDTDGDGRPDYLDQDDDGDGYLTKFEIKKPTPLGSGQGTNLYYPFSPIADDLTTTTIDESEPKGIPDASGNGVLPTRLRRHLNPNSKPPFTVY
jgi:FKBP-type peptidyl-prolyl cis-trans isomerase FkpA